MKRQIKRLTRDLLRLLVVLAVFVFFASLAYIGFRLWCYIVENHMFQLVAVYEFKLLGLLGAIYFTVKSTVDKIDEFRGVKKPGMFDEDRACINCSNCKHR